MKMGYTFLVPTDNNSNLFMASGLHQEYCHQMHFLKFLPSLLLAASGISCGGSSEQLVAPESIAIQSKAPQDQIDYVGVEKEKPSNSPSKERPFAVSGNVVLNPGFELGAANWTQSSSQGYSLISSFSQYPAYAGSQYAWLGGYSDGTDTLYQDISVPSSGSQIKLQFWQRISTTETTTSKAYDTLAIELYNPTTGAKLATIANLSNLNANTSWTQSPQYDITAYKGQRVRLKFTAKLDISDNSSFRFDEVAVFPIDGVTNTSPQTGIWWNPAESGSGLVIEQQGSKVLLGAFMYDDDGSNTWYVSTLDRQSDGSFAGDVVRTIGGQTLNGNYRAPTSSTAVAKAKLAFSSGTNGILTVLTTSGSVLRTLSIERFPLTNPAFTPSNSSFERGFWWNESESGRGFFIEVQGSQALVSSFMYNNLGDPTWYSGTALLQSSQSFTIPLLQYANGQSLAGAYRPPSQTTGSAGNLMFTFSSANTGTMTLPNGRSIAIKRVIFDSSSSNSAGNSGSSGGTSGTSSSGTGTTLASFAGTYSIAATSGQTGSFTIDAGGNVTGCKVGVVVSCTGKATLTAGASSASFAITGNDGNSPVDTTAILNGSITSSGAVSGTFSANSVTEGSASGTITGSRSSNSAAGSGSSGSSGSGTTPGASTCFGALVGTWTNDTIGNVVVTAPDSVELTQNASDGSGAKRYTRLKVLTCSSTSLTYNITEAAQFRTYDGYWDYDYCAPNATVVRSGCDRTSTAVNWSTVYTQAYSFEQGGLKFGTYVYRK